MKYVLGCLKCSAHFRIGLDVCEGSRRTGEVEIAVETAHGGTVEVEIAFETAHGTLKEGSWYCEGGSRT